jgi:hypothetical protein
MDAAAVGVDRSTRADPAELVERAADVPLDPGRILLGEHPLELLRDPLFLRPEPDLPGGGVEDVEGLGSLIVEDHLRAEIVNGQVAATLHGACHVEFPPKPSHRSAIRGPRRRIVPREPGFRPRAVAFREHERSSRLASRARLL